ncbi:MAG: response regulator [Lachnospiraceae bacterium]|nr:response regulator [Lachnospiraceae bacterium]
MNRKIMIVAAAEGFVIKGIETKLKSVLVDSVYSAPRIKDLKENVEHTDLILIFTDEDIASTAKAFSVINDSCAKDDRQVIVIGTKDEFQTLQKYIPAGFILEFFERPLDVEGLLNCVEKYMDEGNQQVRRKNILIVDDDVAYMSMIMDWLKDTYRVSLANSGMQAITWLAKNHADLILLDYEMPITSGPQVLEMIRSDAETADIPVMFLTGRGDKESIMRVLSLKPAGYLLKTVQKKELRDTISTYFINEGVSTK